MAHNHQWECSDVPGLFYCDCGAQAVHNRDTGDKEVINDEI